MNIIFITNVFSNHMAVCQNLVPLVNIKIAGKWMFIPLKMVLIGIDPYPYKQPLKMLSTEDSQSYGWHLGLMWLDEDPDFPAWPGMRSSMENPWKNHGKTMENQHKSRVKSAWIWCREQHLSESIPRFKTTSVSLLGSVDSEMWNAFCDF